MVGNSRISNPRRQGAGEGQKTPSVTPALFHNRVIGYLCDSGTEYGLFGPCYVEDDISACCFAEPGVY